MRLAAFALFLTLSATPALATDVPATEAARHAGETVTVIGVLTNVHVNAKKMISLDIGGTYPDNPFTAVVFAKSMRNPPDFTPLVGKTLAITGMIKMFYGKPEIVINDDDQVKVAH
jgi:DNA/RNA endonuclease YhcR with UshA esterase domain